MLHLSSEAIKKAKSPSAWDKSNEFLYSLCKKYPSHISEDEIVAKILLIGRTYAAAIERRRYIDHFGVENFYLDIVAPKIKESKIDIWLQNAREAKPGTQQGLETMIATHEKVTNLFGEISGDQKRSLASKYLHFHAPKLFYIYDSRAKKALTYYTNQAPSIYRNIIQGDLEYRKFVTKASQLSELCSKQFKTKLNPRQLDNLLLHYTPNSN